MLKREPSMFAAAIATLPAAAAVCVCVRVWVGTNMRVLRYDPATPTQNSAHGPTLGDKLVLKFDQQVDTTIPANTRAEVDALIDIVPRINDIEYVGEWTGKDELTLTFVTEEQVTTYFTDHIRPPYGVGQLQVRMRADSVLRSRDRSSPYMRSQECVLALWCGVSSQPRSHAGVGVL